MLEITIERHDDYVLCRPAGELDAYTVAQFREALTELAEESFVLVDLSDVPFMDSAGLGALIGGIRRARENDGDVAVACNRPALIRLLHTTGFDRIVPERPPTDHPEPRRPAVGWPACRPGRGDWNAPAPCPTSSPFDHRLDAC